MSDNTTAILLVIALLLFLTAAFIFSGVMFGFKNTALVWGSVIGGLIVGIILFVVFGDRP